MTWSRGDNPFDNILGHYQVRNIMEHAKPGYLLDLGCNEGTILFDLLDKGEFLGAIGVDADPEKIIQATKRPVVL